MKSFMDDLKSWGKWQDPGQVQAAPTSEPSGLPQPLTLADIRTGENYVTLRRLQDVVLEFRHWTPLKVLDLRDEKLKLSIDPRGILLRIHEWRPGWYTADTNILPAEYGLLPSYGLWNSGYRTYLATPETLKLIQDIVERQDHELFTQLISLDPASLESPMNVSAFLERMASLRDRAD